MDIQQRIVTVDTLKYFLICSLTTASLFAAQQEPVPTPSDPYKETLFDDTTLHSMDQTGPQTFQVTIEPMRRTKLSTEVQSPVQKINKRLGETFKKGEPLIVLDRDVFVYNLQKTKAALDKANVELAGKKQLFEDKVASLFEVKEAESDVATAESDHAFAKKNIEATTIIAPYDGKVVNLDIEENELPQKGQQVIEVINDKTVVAKLLIPSFMLSKIKVGTPFKIHLPEADKTIDATISRIGAVIDPSSSTIQIEADIDNAEGILRAGMTGNADFEGVEVPATTQQTNPNKAAK